MAGPVARHTTRQPSYSGTAACSLRLAAVVALAMACGGCAVSGPLGSMFSKQDKEQATAYTDDDVSGSVAARKAVLTSATALPPDADLEFARMAIVDMLKRNSKDSSIPWENPSTGARGTVTPIAAAYKREGATCHDFLASYVQRSAEVWMQGEACRDNKGSWEVKSLRPWRRS